MRTLTLILLLALPTLAAEDFPARIDMIGVEIFGIDRSHSYLGFNIGFLGLTKVRGTFNDYSATILYDDRNPERSSLTLVIDAATIDTANEFRDKDLKGPSFFDVEKFPNIVFQSTRIEKKNGDQYVMHGDLTMKGITKPIAIPIARSVRRGADAAWGNIRIGGTGRVTIKRKDFGILGNDFWGDKTLSDEVEIEIDLLGSRPNYDRWSFQPKSVGEVQKTVESSGGAAAAAQLRELKRDKPNDYNFGAGGIGVVINRLMQRRRIEDALPLLEVGRELFPEEPGFFARTGEAHAALGHREEAIRMYEKAQELNPNGTESKEMLRRLRR